MRFGQVIGSSLSSKWTINLRGTKMRGSNCLPQGTASKPPLLTVLTHISRSKNSRSRPVSNVSYTGRHGGGGGAAPPPGPLPWIRDC